jgi:hypothetical protein
MKTEAFPNRQLWLIAAILAVALGAPLSIWVDKVPWLIVVPIIFGASLVAFIEIAGLWRPSREQLELIRMPGNFLGLSRYRGHIALVLPTEKEEPGQKTFDFLKAPARQSGKEARIIKDEFGQEIYAIDSERFVAMLATKLLPNVEKLTEVSLKHVLQRYGEMQHISEELDRFLRDANVLDVIKSDFRGNTSQTLNKSAEAVIRELVKQLKDIKAKKRS